MRTASTERIKLTPVLTIGFAGRCAPSAEAACGAAIAGVLRVEQERFEGVVCGEVGLSGLGDLLFAEACDTAGLPLRVLLPQPAAELMRQWEPMAWARVQRVMRAAVSVDVAGADESAEERLYECALAVAKRSHRLLVLSEHALDVADRLSGVSAVAAFAGATGRTLIEVDVSSGSVSGDAAQSIPAGDLAMLNELPDCGALARNGSGQALVEAWLDKLDRNATLIAPQVRRMAALPITLTALAAFVVAAAEHLEPHALWVGGGAVLGLAAALLPGLLRLSARQASWVRVRTAAELTRSVLAVWQTPLPYLIVGPDVLPELIGMLDALNLLKAQATKQSGRDVSAFKATYLESRVRDQRRYFRRQAHRAAVQGTRFRNVARAATVVAIVFSAWAFAAGGLLHLSSAVGGGRWLPLMTSALFQGATVAGALVVVHDCDRRRGRYHGLDESLGRWETELEAFHTWHPVLEVVDSVERALLVELLEWRSLLMNRKMPRN